MPKNALYRKKFFEKFALSGYNFLFGFSLFCTWCFGLICVQFLFECHSFLVFGKNCEVFSIKLGNFNDNNFRLIEELREKNPKKYAIKNISYFLMSFLSRPYKHKKRKSFSYLMEQENLRYCTTKLFLT